MNAITVAATQMACSTDFADNYIRAEALVRIAKARGAQIVLLQELFAGPYFCQDEEPANFRLAAPVDGHPLIAHFRRLAAELNVVLPISFFERANRAFYNSVAIIDAGTGRCSVSIASRTFLMVPATKRSITSARATRASGFGRLYSAISEWASAGISGSRNAPAFMCLMGADFLLYPTAIAAIRLRRTAITRSTGRSSCAAMQARTWFR